MDEEDFFDAETAGREEMGASYDLCPICSLMLDDYWCHECRESYEDDLL